VKRDVRPDGKDDITVTKHDRKRWQKMAKDADLLQQSFAENGDEANETRASAVEDGLRALLGTFAPPEGTDDDVTIGPPKKSQKPAPAAESVESEEADE
jgi:hypothetical protein